MREPPSLVNYGTAQVVAASRRFWCRQVKVAADVVNFSDPIMTVRVAAADRRTSGIDLTIVGVHGATPARAQTVRPVDLTGYGRGETVVVTRVCGRDVDRLA
jgi:hypothetical protein